MKKIFMFVLFMSVFVLVGCSRNEIIPSVEASFELAGELVVELEVNDVYEELGFVVVDIHSGEDLSEYVVVSDDVDTSKVGTYIISYKLIISDYELELTRTVVVNAYNSNEVSLKLIGGSTIKVDYNSSYVDPFVVATDERLGIDISHKVFVFGLEDIDTSIENELYPISYKLDYNGVIKTIFRIVQINSDTGVSFNVIKDTNTYNTYSVGEVYVEYGVEVIDTIEGIQILDYDIKSNFEYDGLIIKEGVYTIEYIVEIRGNKSMTRRFVTFTDDGISISVNENITSKNSYSVGESYVEYGVTIVDIATDNIIKDYDITHDFEYENGYIKKGVYIIEYNIVYRNVEYIERRYVSFLEAGVSIDINENTATKNTYYVGEKYFEFGIVARDVVTGKLIEDYLVVDEFQYDNFGNIKEGVYLVTYRVELRGIIYLETRTVVLKDLFDKLEFNLDSVIDIGSSSIYVWNVEIISIVSSEDIEINNICYLEHGTTGIKCLSDINNSDVSTSVDELNIISFSYLWNGVEVEGVI